MKKQEGNAVNEMTKAVAPRGTVSPLVALGTRFQIEPTKLMDVLRGTVIKPGRDGRAATNEEVAAFCVVANQYGLNPFTREIHAFADPQKGVVPIVGVDGWTHIVNSRDDFDGCEFEYEDAGDAPVSVTCRIHVKGRSHPVEVTEYMVECKRNTAPWNTMPRRMLRHKAYMQAARYAFGLAGIYDDDEARDIMAGKVIDVEESPAPVEKPKRKSETNPPALPSAEPESSEPEQTQDAEPSAPTPAADPDEAERQAIIAKLAPLIKAKSNTWKKVRAELQLSEDATLDGIDNVVLADALKLMRAGM